MDRLRIGIVGAGFGTYGLLPAFRRDPRCEVIAIATSSEESASRAARTHDIPVSFHRWERLVKSTYVNAIAIATPPMFQAEIALAALSLGKPVFAEKPLAATLADAEMLMKAAGESKVANVVDFLFPELDVFAKAKQLLSDGAIGTPLHIKAEWIFQSADHRDNITTWRTDASSGGGALAHFGSHMIYYLQWFFGRIKSSTAHLAKPSGYSHSGETIANLLLSFENGTTGTLSLSSGSPVPSRHSVEILGSTGSLMLSNTSKNPVAFTLRRYKGQEPAGEPMVEAREMGVDCRVWASSQIVRRFITWILTGEETRPSFRDGFDVQRIIEAARLT